MEVVTAKFHTKCVNSEHQIFDCITKDMIAVSNTTCFKLDTFQNHQTGKTLEDRNQSKISFQGIYRDKIWGSDVLSGGGSTVAYAVRATKVLSSVLAYIKKQFGLTRVKMLDVPCGDMTWMQHFLKARDDIDYTGFDIVPELIQVHKIKFKNYSEWSFQNHDIVENGLSSSFDLIFSRMMLQHLHNDDVLTFLDAVSTSGSKFILTTSFPNTHENIELQHVRGRFHSINLEIPPFSLPPPLCYSRDGPEENNKHYLHLWRLPLQQVRNCSVAHRVPLKLSKTAMQYFSCFDGSFKQFQTI